MNHQLPVTAYPRTCLLPLFAVLFAGSLCAARAEVKMPRIFSDHMVLQKSDKTAVWGLAAPDEDVTVTLDTQSAKTTAGADGKWTVTLNLTNSGPGPFQMTIAGKNQVVISDVLVGQVWVAAGQSNMELRLKDVFGGPDEIAHSANPLLRQFFVSHTGGMEGGAWTLADPSTSGEFSAAGYFFAKKLQNELKVPVAIINTAIGSTCCEQWTSSEGLDTDPELKAAKDLNLQSWATFVDQTKQFPDLYDQWLKQHDREDKPTGQPADFAGMDIPTTDWTKITLPGAVSGAGLPPAGAYWLRKDVMTNAAEIAACGGKFDFTFTASPNDYPTVYWNGEKIIQITTKSRGNQNGYSSCSFGFVPKSLKEGRNVLAIRFFSPVQAPVLQGIQRVRAGALDRTVPPLAGDWLAKAEYALPPVDAAALAAVPPDPMVEFKAVNNSTPIACRLFDGMIRPLIPYTITGVVWYQGENNAERAWQYRIAFPLMIKDWRAHWGLGDFPFYFCQLANLGSPSIVPKESNWAELRESQSLTLKLPNTGEAVLIDIGDPSNIHPRDKKDVGERLALIALANTYHENIPYSGPMYESSTIEGGKIRLSFQHTDGGLVAKPLNEENQVFYSENPKQVRPAPTSPNSDLQGFAICGTDHNWVWADAKIDGATVLVWSDQVPQPVAVRYAWAIDPVCNLYNGADLPASPFRTDDFPLSTANYRYGKPIPPMPPAPQTK